MYKKNTDELEGILMNTHPEDIERFVEDNADELADGDREFMHFMNEKIREKGLKKSDIYIAADISEGYGSKLITQEKTTRQRDVILRLCYAAQLTLSETQHALQLYHMERLYARNKRDALIMVCFNERPGSVIDLNDYLKKNGLQPLKSSGAVE